MTEAQPLAQRREEGVALFVGVVAVLIAGLQPLLLGGLEREGRISAAEIGLAATIELLAIGLTCGLAAAMLKPVQVRGRIFVFCLLHAAITFAGIGASGAMVILNRGLAGICEGLMLWMTISMIVRSSSPERCAGVFATVQTLAQLLMAAGLAAFVTPSFGVNGALIVLSLVSVLAAVSAFAGPRAYAPLPVPEPGAKGLFGLRALGGLGVCFLFLAFIVAVWVYLEPLAALSGIAPSAAGFAISLALGAQVLGALAATIVGPRLNAAWVLLALGVVNAGVLITLGAQPDEMLFFACLIVFGFAWMFALPFQTQLMIDLDPSRRAAMQVGAAQLLGSSFGPLVAALIVGEDDIAGALNVALVFLAVAVAIIVGLIATRPSGQHAL